MSRCKAGGRCEGDGWVRVGPGYVDQVAPWPPPPQDQSPEALEQHAAAMDTARILREAAANAVYPCRDCEPEMFARYIGRHWAPDHDRAACAQCPTGSSSGRRRNPAALNEREGRVQNEPDEELPPLESYEQTRADLR